MWIVDDAPLERAHARRVLEDRYQVDVFGDGLEVLERITAGEKPDLLVLDWLMPGLSGVDLCRFLRASPSTATLPVLILTAQRDTPHVVEGLRAGANDYLAKPFAPEELVVRVDALVHAKLLRERAERAERSLRSLLASLPDAVLLVDPSGVVVYANDQAVRIAEGVGKKLLGRPVAEIVPGLDVGRAAREVGGSEAPPDVVIGAGQYSALVRRVVEDTGESTVVSLRDVTRKREHEARRLDFYSMVAHDLRSPLSAMLMRVDWLLAGRRGQLPADARADVLKIEARIRELVEMINDFLDIARMDSTGLELHPERLDVNEIAQATTEEYRHVALASRIALGFEPAPEAACVDADRGRLVQVLTNLVSNAVKFTPPGGSVTVRVEVTPERVRTLVVDTGRGIPPEAIPRLFNRYERGPNVPRGVGGTGLGLLIVREIVAAHDGIVEVASEVGRGSTFRFELRRAGCLPGAAAGGGA